MTRRNDREDGIQRQRQTESDIEEGLQTIKPWTIAMQSLIEEELHSQLLMVHFPPHQEATQTMCAVMSMDRSLPLSLSL